MAGRVARSARAVADGPRLTLVKFLFSVCAMGQMYQAQSGHHTPCQPPALLLESAHGPAETGRIRDPGGAGRRGNGKGLPWIRPHARPPGRHQSRPQQAPGRRGQAALSARGPRLLEDQPPQHHYRLRRRRRGRPAVHGHGVHRRQGTPRRDPHGRDRLEAGTALDHRRPRCPGPAPRRGHHPPRPQAGKHHGDERRRHQADGLRTRPPRRPDRAHRRRHHAGYGAVYVTRTGHGQEGGHA